jgi:hypothetical protein
MAEQVLEGTWEEIARHADELSGKRMRLMVLEECSPRQVGQSALEERPLAEMLEGLVGVIDSREPFAPPEREGDVFGESVVEKLRKQGPGVAPSSD